MTKRYTVRKSSIWEHWYVFDTKKGVMICRSIVRSDAVMIRTALNRQKVFKQKIKSED